MKILVTGAAGFIGYHTSKLLLDEEYEVTGIDNLNDYYDPSLKKDRLKCLKQYKNFQFLKLDLIDEPALNKLFERNNFEVVVHLAAQAGIRYSLVNPRQYLESNIIGSFNILELSKKYKISHLVYASTSSVYGANRKLPFHEDDTADHPLQFYAASKRSSELMAHSYAHLYKIPCTGLRFFTVYGPWGRPDMALFKFTENILKDKPIEIYNNGNHTRDFTFVDDISEAIGKIIKKPPKENDLWDPLLPQSSFSSSPFRVFNIGNSKPVKLMEYVYQLEKSLNKEAIKVFSPRSDGDILETHADIDNLTNFIGYSPKTSVKEGIDLFVKWYLDYYEGKL